MNFKRGFLNKRADMSPEFALAIVIAIILGGLFLWVLYQKLKGAQ